MIVEKSPAPSAPRAHTSAPPAPTKNTTIYGKEYFAPCACSEEKAVFLFPHSLGSSVFCGWDFPIILYLFLIFHHLESDYRN